ncbi:invasion associated locus B family protein [Tropicimonas sp. IMCC34043]|uniref:invasion associated locus B family protein n=1 Tax=Tropicimonas sp. IMCC34043 TaxID=2248760 RepID=UPI000E26FF98|nr:invasion associated locus B family protein [Tropicimonas sp. IMCC34043]
MTTHLTNPLSILALAAMLAAAPALAQETATTPPPAAPATAPAEAPAESDLGKPYVKDVSGDWEIHCVHTDLDADPCTLHQVLRDDNGSPVATMEIVNIPGNPQLVAGLTIVTPLDTLLTEQVAFSIDGGQAAKYPFSFCTPRGCVSRVAVTNAELDAIKRGNQGKLQIVPLAAPDQKVDLAISLAGVTSGFDTLTELNAAYSKVAQEAAAAKQATGN